MNLQQTFTLHIGPHPVQEARRVSPSASNYGEPSSPSATVSTHCKKGIVIMTDSLLSQIQMSEHNSLLCGGELHDNLFLILSQLSSTLSYHLGN